MLLLFYVIEHRTIFAKGVPTLPQVKLKDKKVETAKKALAKEIIKCRGNISQRKLAGTVGLPPSNMKYIEDGVNAPSADVYEKLITVLRPKPRQRKKMDHLYGLIRKTPPPDVCKIITNNEDIVDAVRMLSGQVLTANQIESAKILFAAFAEENRKGAIENG